MRFSKAEYPELAKARQNNPLVAAEIKRLIGNTAASRVVHQIGAMLADEGLLNGFARGAAKKPLGLAFNLKATPLKPVFTDESLPPAVRWGIKPGKALDMFHLLAAHATGTMDRVRKEAVRNLKHKKGSDPKRTVRGLLARTKGPSRRHFMASLLRDTPQEHWHEVLECASGFYRDLGNEVSAKQLRKEAETVRK